MAKTNDDGLKVMAPEPVTADERSPLLSQAGGQRPEDGDALEAQAEQEQREYDAGAVPIADEPSTKKLLLTMSSLWLSTFFAALGNTSPNTRRYGILIRRRCYNRSHSFWTNNGVFQ